jgi:hypothetical protein
VSGDSSAIGGGSINFLTGVAATIAGGTGNQVTGNYSAIGGGLSNYISGEYSNIFGGRSNNVYNNYSSIIGGTGNINSGQHSFIGAGSNVKIYNYHTGATVLADSQNRDHFSKGNHTCSLDFASGVYLRLPSFTGPKNQAGNTGELKVSGEYLYIATGQDTWGRIQILSFP